ncbi:MAG: hypothetical protein H6623_04370 [Bdellovibrionaceae bacterium]|nr:hypothetical protein [Pseudobdellovibrionaceae bacterium]
MKAMLFLLTICILPVSGFAKSKPVQFPVRMKFTPYVYYKLDFAGRIQYLNAFIEVAQEADGKLRAEGHQEQFLDIFNFMIPQADAAGNVCLLGGIFFDLPTGVKSCEDVEKVPSDLQFKEIESLYTNTKDTPNCKPENRCASYFGVTSSGNGFCFQSAGNATSECSVQSKKNDGVKNLAAILNNCSAHQDKCSALQKAMAKDQDKLSAYCDAHSKSGACRRSKKTIASLTKAASKADAGTSIDQKTGCTEANLHQMGGSSADSLAKQLNLKNGVDPYWYQLARTAGLACDSGKKIDTDQIFANVGVCEAKSSSEVACQGSQEELGKCINGEIERLGNDKFRELLADIDSTVCKKEYKYKLVSTGKVNCAEGKNPLEIRNAVENGKLQGLEKVISKICPTQSERLLSCRKMASGDDVKKIDAKPDVAGMLRNSVEAEGAVKNLESSQHLTKNQEAGFQKMFGISTKEFKSMFCAKSPSEFTENAEKILAGRQKEAPASDFKMGANGEIAYTGKPEAHSPMFSRMMACASQSVQMKKAFNKGKESERARSNYQDRACKQAQITSIRESELREGMKNYLYYEKDTGRCYKGSEITREVPSGVKSSCSSKCNTEKKGVISEPHFIKLDHSYSGSDAEPCYACMDKDFFDSKKFEIYQVRCQTDPMGGLDFSPAPSTSK